MYLSEHRSLAAVETLVHVPRVQLLRDRYVMISVDLPLEIVDELDRDALPAGWNDPNDMRAAQRVGDLWLDRGSSAALRVPSVVIRDEFNVIVSPDHPEALRMDVGEPESFLFDARLHQ